MARTVLLSRRVLNSPFGSSAGHPLETSASTAFLRARDADDAVVGPDGHPLGRRASSTSPLRLRPGRRPLMRARSCSASHPSSSRPVTMSSICWDADASVISTLCCGCSAPSGPKGSVPCPCGGCSQANNTPPLPLQQLGLHSLDVLAPRYCFLRPDHPADPFIAGKRGEVFPRSENLWVGNQDASQIHRELYEHSAGDRPGLIDRPS